MRVSEAVKLRILDLCQEHHITLNKLSTICGITQSTLNNIISGRNATTTVSTTQKSAMDWKLQFWSFLHHHFSII